MFALLTDRILKVFRQIRYGLQYGGVTLGVMLEISQHLGEIRGPNLQLEMITGRHAQHFGGHDGGQRLGQVRNHIHLASGFNSVEQMIDDVGDVSAQFFNPRRSKSFGRQPAQARVRRSVHEQHLLYHDARNRA